MLRPEQLVLSGHGVCHCMLKGGTYYGWTVMMKGCTNVQLTLYGSLLFFGINPLTKYMLAFKNYLANRYTCQ